jgi:nucleotide-binding universal stress UspA family protein
MSRPFTIVCGVDLSESSNLVIERALAEGSRHPHVAIHFCTVIEPGELSDDEVKQVGESLRSLVGECLPAFSDESTMSNRRLRFHVRSGRPEEQLLELAFEARTDLVVVGGHSAAKRYEKRFRIGEFMTSAAHCTVYVVRVADYDEVSEDYASCSACVRTREESDGNRWFCEKHSSGRIPRLTDHIGITTPTPGWGIF